MQKQDAEVKQMESDEDHSSVWAKGAAEEEKLRQTVGTALNALSGIGEYFIVNGNQSY